MLEIKDLAVQFYNLVCEPNLNLDQLGRLLHQNWLSKKGLSDKISNSLIDTYYSAAMENGAYGGKILGAGGGGFLFLLADKENHPKIIESLNQLELVNFNFEPIGTRTLLNF